MTKKLFEVLDEVRSLEDIMTRYIEKGEINNELVANWVFNALKLVEELGKIVEQIEDRLDLLEEETEQKEF